MPVAARSLANRFHRDTISIYPPATAGAVLPDFTVDFTQGTARLASVAAHVEPLASSRLDPNSPTMIEEIAVKVAPDIGDTVASGDRVVIEASEDAALVDLELIVVRVEARTRSFTRRIICKRLEPLNSPGQASG